MNLSTHIIEHLAAIYGYALLLRLCLDLDRTCDLRAAGQAPVLWLALQSVQLVLTGRVEEFLPTHHLHRTGTTDAYQYRYNALRTLTSEEMLSVLPAPPQFPVSFALSG